MRPFVNRCRRQETHELLTMLSWTRTGTRTRTWPPPRTKFIHITTNTTSHLCLTIFTLFLKPLEVIVQHFSQLVLCQNPCSSHMSRFTCHSACCFEIQVAQQQLLSDQNGDKQHRPPSKLIKSKNYTLDSAQQTYCCEITPPSRYL